MNSETPSNLASLVSLSTDERSVLPPRERVLLAALELFVEQGYFNTNVPDLSKVSTCSVGSIYHHFRNKEEVAAALYTEGITAFRDGLIERMKDASSVEPMIKTIVGYFLEFTEQNVLLSKYLWLSRHAEFMKGDIPHPTRVGFDGLGRMLTKAIRTGMRDGTVRSLKATVMWSIIFGIPLSYARDWLDGYNPDAPTVVAAKLQEVCWNAVKA